MFHSFKSISTIGIAVFLAGCAPEPTVRTVQPEPIYDKFGAVAGCTDGSTPEQVPGTVPERVNPCVPPPDDDCPNGSVDTATGQIICLPEDEDRNPDPRGDPGRDPVPQ